MTFRAWSVRLLCWLVPLFTLLAATADAASASTGASLGMPDVLRVGVASAAWAAMTSFVATALLLLLGWAASRLSKQAATRIGLGAIGAAIPVGAVLLAGGLDLLSGPGVSEKKWVGAARIGWAVFAPIATMGFAWLASRMLAPRPGGGQTRIVLPVCVAAACAAGAALAADRAVYPRLYPVAHLLLWLAIYVAALVTAAALTSAWRRSYRVLGIVAGMLGGWSAVALVFADPLRDAPFARAAAYRETLFLKRALTHLKPAAPAPPITPDPAIVEALNAARRLDDALIDRSLPDRRRMNVLVISIDAVRADRLGRNGYARPVTPNLDALLARGAYFRNAWTTYPFTLMAFQSAFSGVYASATDHFRYRELGLWSNPFPPRPTVVSLLRKLGWRTEAVVGFPRLVKESLEKELGFEYFNAEAGSGARGRDMPAGEIATLAISALDREPERPFFLWVHFFDPHAPYSPPGPHPFGESRADLYDAELLYADREAGRLLDALASRDLLRKTAIVVFSDHGEDLVEFDHGTALTEEQIHVPFGIVLPGVPPRDVALAVDLTDLAPTVLELVGASSPERMHGQSLLPCVLLDPAATGAFPPDVAFCELGGARLPQPRQFAAREGSMKIVCHADSQTCQIFDLAADPRERVDLSGRTPDVLARMKRLIDSLRSLSR